MSREATIRFVVGLSRPFLIFLSHRGAADPRTPRSEFSRFAPGPRAPNSQEKQHAGKQNHEKSNQKYKKQQTQGGGREAPAPLGCRRRRHFVVFIISDCFSYDFACRHAVFLVNLGPWALERSDLTQSGGVQGAAVPRWLKNLR